MTFLSKKLELLEKIVYLGCVIMLLIQVLLSFKDYFMYRTIPTIKTTGLDDIVFPRILICPKVPFNTTAVDMFKVIKGITLDSNDKFERFIGWGENETPSNFMAKIANKIDGTDGYLLSFDNEESKFNVMFEKMQVSLQVGFCLGKDFTSEEINLYLKKQAFFRMNILIKNPENVRILMIDRNKFNGYFISKDDFHGDKILEDENSKQGVYYYDIHLSETQLDPKDKDADCKEYDPGYSIHIPELY